MTTILALDPAISTGYCVINVEYRTATVVEYGYIDVDQSSVYTGDWSLNLQRRLDEIYKRVQPTEIAVEYYFFSGRFKQGANINPYFRGAIHMWARSKGLHYEILNISNWKVFVAGRSTPTKLQKLAWGKEPAKKLMIQEALWTRWGIRFPNHSLSESTNKPILFRYDIVDAVAQAMYAAYLRFNCNNFKCIVPVPADVVFKKASKKSFVYV
jgi:Holliday junction resolvasome RuvABC endonuclease subunit